MSGIGEVLAIVSCVAGLIQAYDAGSRIVKQIKTRRQAHGALPPSDLLEESIDKGRREIKQLVEDGTKRFGPSFEEGDTTAQLALYKITIATQQALLDGLTQAREDDGIIDFDYCIDTSDKGRNEALLALHQLFQRKLEEEMERKRLNPPTRSLAPESRISPPPYQQATGQKSPQLDTAPRKEDQQPPPSPLSKSKRSRTFGDVVFRRKSNNQHTQTSPQAATGDFDRVPELSPRISQHDIKPGIERQNTNASMRSNATRSSTSSGSTVGHPGSLGRSDTSASSITMVSRRDTSLSAMSAMSSTSVMTMVSAASDSSISPITKYGACCKYAYEIRDGRVNKGLMLQMMGFYGTGRAAYKCSSVKCEFQFPALQEKRGYKIDDRCFASTVGIHYRWLFLAKSHIQQLDARYPAYRCLICVLLKDDSGLYYDTPSLFEHVVSHQGAFLGDTSLEGRLIFDNHGAKHIDTSDFDIEFPETMAVEPPEPPQGVAVVVAATLPLEPHQLDYRVPPSRAPAISTYAYEPDDNPWANI